MHNDEIGLGAARVLVVEAGPNVLNAISDALTCQGYHVTSAESAETGLEAAKEQMFDIVLCSLDVGGMGGIEFMRQVCRMHPQMPVVAITAWGDIEASRQALEAGASDFITEPIELGRLPFALESNLQRKRVELHRMSEQRADVLFKAVKALAAAVDGRTRFTGKHSAHMAELCLEIGQELGLPPDRMTTLELAAHIHDVGKIGTSDAILTKPGKLTPDEWQEVLQHPQMGADFLAGIDELAEVASVVRHHHERMDGAGYPDGLKGEAIPFLSRILAVADTFEAMTSERPYRAPSSWEQALRELDAHSGTQFDPVVVTAATRVILRALGLEEQQKRAA